MNMRKCQQRYQKLITYIVQYTKARQTSCSSSLILLASADVDFVAFLQFGCNEKVKNAGYNISRKKLCGEGDKQF